MNDLIYGNALEEFEQIEEGSVDLLLTDPPYNISTDFELGRDSSEGGKYVGSNVSHDFGEWDKEKISLSEWLPLFEPLLKENSTVVVFYDYLKMGELVETMEDLGWTVRQPVIWHKSNPIPQGYAVKWQEAVEMGMIATVNEGQGHKYQKEEGQRHNVIETSLCSGKERYDHPTQKPEKLIEPILNWWTEQDDVIFDPFAGTGTIPAVSKRMGREYIAIEQEEEYYDIMEQRVEETENYEEGSIFNQ